MTGFAWDDLQFFLAVARTGQLSAAARELRTNHVTVSRRIDRLERELSVRLFERSPRGYMLTALGERLVEDAEAIERGAARLAEIATHGPASPRGVVRLSTPEGFGHFFLAERLPALAARHPGLAVEFVTIQQIVSLSRREADVAVSLHSPRSGPYRNERIAAYRLFVYAAPAYLAAAAPIRAPADLAGHPVIGYIDDLIFTPGLDYLREILPGQRAAYQCSSIHAQLSAALAGLGLAILPHFIALRHPELVPVLAHEVRVERDYWLIVPDRLAGTPRIRVVTDFVRAQALAFAPQFRGDALLGDPAPAAGSQAG